jgi:L-asparaginase
MKVLFVFTGGTIGSTLQDDYINVDAQKPYKIIYEYKNRYGIDFEYDVVQPYTELSENNTGKTILQLIQCLKANITTAYDGVIVTHGTDTIQYSAAALSYAFGNNSIPICMVSSNYPIEDEHANGLMNLRCSLLFIQNKLGTGVWMIYKNSNGNKTYAHRGTQLLASQTFSDCFYSAKDNYYGYFDEKEHFYRNESFTEVEDGLKPIEPIEMQETCDFICRITPYPGICYPAINSQIKYVLLEGFHSGTIDTKSASAISFFKAAHAKGIQVFLTGASNESAYASTKEFEQLHIKPLLGITPIAAFLKLWIYG